MLFRLVIVLVLFFVSGFRLDPVSDGGLGVDDQFTFIKKVNIMPREIQNGFYDEFSYVFIKGTSYRIDFISEMTTEVEFAIYDNNRNIIFSQRKSGAINNIFSCQASGIYYMRYTPADHLRIIGTSTLSFRR